MQLFGEQLYEKLNTNFSSKEEKEKVLTSLADQKGICEKLYRIIFQDKDLLLKQLKNEAFEERRLAKELLIISGKKNIESIKQLIKTTTDPEQKALCREIIKTLLQQKFYSSRLMNNALFIILHSNDNPPSNRAFLEYYFANYASLPLPLRQLLPKALQKSKNRKELLSSIQLLIKQTLNGKLTNQEKQDITNQISKYSPDLSKNIKAWDEYKKLNIESVYDDWYKSQTGWSIDNIEKVAYKIENIPNFHLIKKDVIKELINSERPLLCPIGIMLVADNPVPYAEEIINTLKRKSKKSKMTQILTPLDNTWIYVAMGSCKKQEEAFSPYIDLFLQEPDFQSYTFALSLIRNPEKYKKLILENALKCDFRSDESARFLMEHFSDEKEYFQTCLIKKLQQKKRIPVNLQNYAYTLSIFEYQGESIVPWLLTRIDEKKSDAAKLTPRLLQDLNIPSDIVADKLIPLWRKLKKEERIDNLSDYDATYLLECDKKYKSQVISFMFDIYLSSPAVSSANLIKYILIEEPERLEMVVDAAIQHINRACKNKIDDVFETPLTGVVCWDLALWLSKQPANIKILRPYLNSNQEAIRTVAAFIMLNINPKDSQAAEIISNTIRRKSPVYNYFKKYIFSALTTIRPVPEKTVVYMLTDIIDYIKKNAKPNSMFLQKNQEILTNLTDAHKILLPLLEKTLEENRKNSQIALITSLMILNIDPQNRAAIAALKGIVLHGKINEASEALLVLTNYNIKIKIPPERLRGKIDFYLVDMALKAALNNEDNLDSALPIICEGLKKDVLSRNDINKLLYTSKKALDIIFPIAMEKYLNNNKNSFTIRKILKKFPERMQPFIPQLLKKYKSLSDNNNINLMTDLIVTLKLNAEPFIKTLKQHYKTSSESQRALYYDYALALISPEKEDRLKYTKKFVDYLSKNLSIFNKDFLPIEKPIRITEFPKIIHPLLIKIKNRNIYTNLHTVLTIIDLRQFSPFYMNILKQTIRDYSSGKIDSGIFYLIIYSLRANLTKEMKALLPELEKIPDNLKQLPSIRLLIRELDQKRN